MKHTSLISAFFISLMMINSVIAQEGLITLESSFTVAQTMERAEQIVSEGGFTIFARIDHAAGAASVDQTLRPTRVLIFGNPLGGTPFMQCAQTVGIDLPVRFLIWEDAASQVHLSYNDPVYLAQRHDAENCTVAQNMQGALGQIAEAIVSP